MELNITAFFENCAPRDYSASVAEIGQSAGADTWRAANEDAAEFNLLDTEEKRDAFKNFVRSAGAWTDAEIDAWTLTELNALCIQWISGDMREPVGFELGPKSTDAEWGEYQRQSEQGQAGGRLFKSDNQFYWSMN